MEDNNSVEISTARVIIECFKAEGIKYVIGIPGSQILDLLDVIYNEKEKIRFILVRDERTASFMADGYAIASRSPGVCISTLGPGATNMVTGISAAYKASSPVIAITGKSKRQIHQKDYFQEIDEVEIFKAITKYSYMITHSEQAPDIIRKAFRIALSGRPGPVHINIPSDLLGKSIPFTPSFPSNYRPTIFSPYTTLEKELVEEILDLIMGAESPALFVGGEVLWEEAVQELIELAELLSLPAITTVNHLDAFPSTHYLGMGSGGKNGWESARKVLESADVVLAVGVHLNYLTTVFSPKFFKEGTKIIHVSSVPERIGAVYKVDCGILSNVRPFIKSMLEEVKKQRIKRTMDSKFSEWKKEYLNKLSSWEKDVSIPVKPGFLAYTLSRVMPEDAIYVLDGGNFAKFIRQSLLTYSQGTFFDAENFGTVGSGFPLAMGVKLANPDKPVVCVCGDGAFSYTLGDLETAKRENINVLTVIFNDHGYGNIRSYQKRYFKERYMGCNFDNPDYGEMAKLFGLWGRRITQPSEVKAALIEGLGQKCTAVIDVKTDPWELGEPTHEQSK